MIINCQFRAWDRRKSPVVWAVADLRMGNQFLRRVGFLRGPDMLVTDFVFAHEKAYRTHRGVALRYTRWCDTGVGGCGGRKSK